MRHILFCLSILLYLNSSAQQQVWDHVALFESYESGVLLSDDDIMFCYGQRDTAAYEQLNLDGDFLDARILFRDQLEGYPQFVKRFQEYDLIFTFRNLFEYYPAVDSLAKVDSFPWGGSKYGSLAVVEDEDEDVFWIIKNHVLYRYHLNARQAEVHLTGHADKLQKFVPVGNNEYLLLSVDRERKNSRLEVLDSSLTLLKSTIVEGELLDVCPLNDGYCLVGQKGGRGVIIKVNFQLEEQSLPGFVDFWEDMLVAVEVTNDGRLFALSFSVGDSPQYPSLYTNIIEFASDGYVLSYFPIIVERQRFEPRVIPMELFAIENELLITGVANATDVSSQHRSFIARIKPAPVSTRSEANHSFEVYPNPVVDKLYIDNSEDVDVIKVYSADGRYFTSLTDWSQGIETTLWPTGAYQLVAHTNDRQYTRKIIKN